MFGSEFLGGSFGLPLLAVDVAISRGRRRPIRRTPDHLEDPVADLFQQAVASLLGFLGPIRFVVPLALEIPLADLLQNSLRAFDVELSEWIEHPGEPEA